MTQSVRAANPGTVVGEQVTLVVRVPRPGGGSRPVRIRIDNIHRAPNGRYQLGDAKHSGVHDLSNPATPLRPTLTPNQRIAYDAIRNGTAVSVTPVGQNAVNAGLTPGRAIPVNSGIDIHVNNPAGGITTRTY